MLDGNRCERCKEKILSEKAKYNQTKYCEICAVLVKKEQAAALRIAGRKYMLYYMRAYRCKHPKLSTKYVRKFRAKHALQRALAQSQEIDQPGVHSKPAAHLFLCFPLVITSVMALAGYQLNFDTICALISHLHRLFLEATSLGVIGIFCLRHLAALWKNIKQDLHKTD